MRAAPAQEPDDGPWNRKRLSRVWEVIERLPEPKEKEPPMYSIFYLIGLIVVVLAIISFIA